MTTVCCLCTGNTCRSPMLAALLRQTLEPGQHTVLSAGVAAANGQPASEQAVACMAARGIDLGDHRSQALDADLLGRCELWFCLGHGHAQTLRSLGVPDQRITVVNGEQGGIPDPFGGDQACYERCAMALEAALPGLAQLL